MYMAIVAEGHNKQTVKRLGSLVMDGKAFYLLRQGAVVWQLTP